MSRSPQPNEESILLHARIAFAKREYEDVILKEIAREACMSHVTLYRHYPTKMGLFSAALDSTGDALLASLRLIEPASPRQRLLDMLLCILRHFAGHERLLAAMDRKPFLRELLVLLTCGLAEAEHAGEICVTHLPMAARALVGLVRYEILHPLLYPEQMAERILLTVTSRPISPE